MGQESADKNECQSLAGFPSYFQQDAQELHELADLFLQLDTKKRSKILKQFKAIAEEHFFNSTKTQ